MPDSNSSRQIIEHLKKNGHEPVDCGAYVYDAEDDYPAFCITAAAAHRRRPGQSRDRDRRLGQRRADRREQGARCPLRAGLEHRDRIAGPPAQQRSSDRHRRAYAYRRRGRSRSSMRSCPRRGRKPNATNAVSTSSPNTSALTSRRRCPARRTRRARRSHAAPAGPAASAQVRPSAGCGVQPAGPFRRRCGGCRTDGCCDGPARTASICSTVTSGGAIVHVHLGLYGSFTDSEVPMALPVGEVRMRMVGAEFGTDLRGPTACEVLDEARGRRRARATRPRPVGRDADPARSWKRIRMETTGEMLWIAVQVQFGMAV